MTEAEKILWKMIRDNQLSGYHFRRQHPINRFVADFYCHELKLVIEIDGSIHDLQKERDEGRTEEMQLFGIHVLRYTNEEVL